LSGELEAVALADLDLVAHIGDFATLMLAVDPESLWV
jgi:hypothetical protein